MKHIVVLSGGRDSAAMALRLTKLSHAITKMLLLQTGNEPLEMIRHWVGLTRMLMIELFEACMPGVYDSAVPATHKRGDARRSVAFRRLCPTLQVAHRPRMVGARMVRYSFSWMTLPFTTSRRFIPGWWFSRCTFGIPSINPSRFMEP
jgi:hypothetical protein